MAELTPLAFAAIVLIGAFSGFSAGLVGSAGAYLALALLTIMLGDAHAAIGTTLVYVFVVCIIGAIAHLRAGRFSPRVSLALGIPAASTAVLGAWIAEYLSDRVLSLGVAALAAIVVITTLLHWGQRDGDGDDDDTFTPNRATYVGAVTGGLGLGVLQGMFGIGGGFLLVPYLVVVLKVPPRLAVACALVAGIPSLFAGGLSHVVLDNVHYLALVALLAGALPSTWLGAAATGRVSVALLRNVLIGLLTVSVVALIVLPI
ncbi:MAG: sulfite exporter TauE/SafE family protein [Pseudonocardiales bacterium]|nr:sulfite exporter TauE/SafE family protein [Pseudonocardiales bacterium]